eukprot:gene19274-23043_t
MDLPQRVHEYNKYINYRPRYSSILHIKNKGWFVHCGGPIDGPNADPEMFHTFRMNKPNVGVTDKARREAYFRDNEKIDQVYQVLGKFVPQQIAVGKAKGLHEEGVSVRAPLRQVNIADRVELGASVTRDDCLFVDKDAASVAPSRGGAGSEGDMATEDKPHETLASKGASGRKRMRSDLADGYTLQKR